MRPLSGLLLHVKFRWKQQASCDDWDIINLIITLFLKCLKCHFEYRTHMMTWLLFQSFKLLLTVKKWFLLNFDRIWWRGLWKTTRWMHGIHEWVGATVYWPARIVSVYKYRINKRFDIKWLVFNECNSFFKYNLFFKYNVMRSCNMRLNSNKI